VVYDKDGTRIETAYDLNLWEADPESGAPSSVTGPLDPGDYPIDPLTLV
jgi:hypothetical protein